VLGLTHFHPDLTLLIAAALAIPVGVVLWLNSVKEAPILLAFFLATLGFLIPWLLPLHHLNFLTHASIGLGGVVLGIILGTICFRFSQAVFLAILVGGILGGGLAYHDGAFTRRDGHADARRGPATKAALHPAAASTMPSSHPASIPVALAKAVTAPHGTLPQYARRLIVSAYQNTKHALARLSPSQTSAVWSLVAGSALLTLLLAIIFPQLASLAGGVWGGSLLMMAGTVVWVDRWRPDWINQAFATAWPQGVFLLLLVLGTVVQSRHLFKLKAARKGGKTDGGKKPKAAGEKK